MKTAAVMEDVQELNRRYEYAHLRAQEEYQKGEYRKSICYLDLANETKKKLETGCHE
ncbi:hypothetical protein [Sediminibacillus massiliensis]|uniref:hypothetical protein n=1 Tax=Sediminibacillus massiliensis TaxID=1926277 RepID=UPI0015C40ABE|nr:hypothetical protein [Sediminibacillus massiliensis]